MNSSKQVNQISSSDFSSHNLTKSDAEFESDSKVSSKIDYFANANEQVHLKSYEERFNEQKRKEETEKKEHNKIVGGIKVYPTIPREHKQAELIRQVNRLKEFENEYNFIDAEKTFSKEVSLI